MILTILTIAAISTSRPTPSVRVTPKVSTPAPKVAPKTTTPRTTTTKPSTKPVTAKAPKTGKALPKSYVNTSGQSVVYRENGTNWFVYYFLFFWLINDHHRDARCYDKDKKQIDCKARG